MSRHSENHKNKYLIFNEGPTHGITDSNNEPGKNLALFLLKQKQHFV